MNRFGDIDLSIKRLPPVYGYRSAQLVSIEQALESIQPQIDELPYYIKIAKKHCHYPSEHNLTKDESASIYIYTMEWGETSLYRLLNKALRDENRQVLEIWFPFLKLFDTALDKLPTVKEILWRGISIDIGKFFTKNQLVTWWSVNSCSSSINIIKKFLGKNKSSTLFLIETINGKRVSGYTEYETEDEVILKIGTQFRVKAEPLDQSNGSHIVHLIEIDDDDDDDDENNITSAMKNIQVGATSVNQGASGGKINSSSCSPSININTKWKQNGITIAGGNGEGSRLTQLNCPEGIYVDNKNQTIYIADWLNHRIVEWKSNEKNGQVVAGGNGSGIQMNQLNEPKDVIVDEKNNSLIICDLENRRVVRWSRQNHANKEIIIFDIDCSRLAMDNNGNLYVSCREKNEVRRWKIGDTNGILVAGGNSKGNNLNQLDWPTYLFIDDNHSIYVSNYGNHRVMKWMKGAKEGIIVAGGQNQGNSLTQLSYPCGIFVDQWENVYVADMGNDRIMRWSKGSKKGSIIIGGNGRGNQSNQLHYPTGLSFDKQGNLYVVDSCNNRVQKFLID